MKRFHAAAMMKPMLRRHPCPAAGKFQGQLP
jgi:hypothetical protein